MTTLAVSFPSIVAEANHPDTVTGRHIPRMTRELQYYTHENYNKAKTIMTITVAEKHHTCGTVFKLHQMVEDGAVEPQAELKQCTLHIMSI